MKPLVTIIITILIVVAGYGLLGLLRVKLRPHILEVHTKFLFNQLEENLKKEKNPPTSIDAFLQIIETKEIDWNSCKMEQQTVFDGWNEPIKIEFNDSTKEWSFHSSGANKLWADSDDITKAVKQD